ncbi:peptidoglycan-binding protein [bacterium C-53]|nr:peptidoglycan-binding protein [Lachnospiraceae bacterium]NBI04089.1 peptidoglycan-binding protein [Lachnospiraceae bacterium]RKJ08722.1 peptidoglycan-binding protein [bacterium C-53]
MDTNTGTDVGRLLVNVTSTQGMIPIPNAEVTISNTGTPETPIETVETNAVGKTDILDLPTPPIEYSLEPEPPSQPYSEYNIKIEAEGYEPAYISGAQLLSGEEAVQTIRLNPVSVSGDSENYVIPPHTLYGDYPPKIAEALIKPVEETGEIVLSRVVVPEYVIVHDGVPDDSTAMNYYVRYPDYIKNVAASEIYATWPADTIRANVLAIMSFTLNRVYTEWYRNKLKDFTITSSTAYDQKWMPGRNTFENIDRIVDELINHYLSKPGVSQPIFTWYCDGQRATCENGMTQWGSKFLGEEGYTPIQILRYYYGSTLYINTADEIAGIPSSWPGTDLSVGSRGPKVRQMQMQLNRISDNFTLIPKISVDGIFGPATEEAVRVFQSVFDLPATGIVDFPTWYKISNVYVGVTRIAEPY